LDSTIDIAFKAAITNLIDYELKKYKDQIDLLKISDMFGGDKGPFGDIFK
jgi:hypothetical protein